MKSMKSKDYDTSYLNFLIKNRFTKQFLLGKYMFKVNYQNSKGSHKINMKQLIAINT